jgi:hypothetical protein
MTVHSKGRPGRAPRFAAVLLGTSLAVLAAPALLAGADEQSRARSGRSTKAAGGQSAKSDAEASLEKLRQLEAKLDQILGNQERLFKRLDEVMEELKIVKIRATLR